MPCRCWPPERALSEEVEPMHVWPVENFTQQQTVFCTCTLLRRVMSSVQAVYMLDGGDDVCNARGHVSRTAVLTAYGRYASDGEGANTYSSRTHGARLSRRSMLIVLVVYLETITMEKESACCSDGSSWTSSWPMSDGLVASQHAIRRYRLKLFSRATTTAQCLCEQHHSIIMFWPRHGRLIR